MIEVLLIMSNVYRFHFSRADCCVPSFYLNSKYDFNNSAGYVLLLYNVTFSSLFIIE